ncbi:uncharacterized protein IL334_003242 [Kwoniella shivajii]|uniref:HTH CENPB-type domain-containing protein n=1 Tax=Kwoniella shivajii TaxID=564305 RepID=A0ABZ1CYQ8_9TREE|nr:hypothetical protein IL334_003242 [Kwoniella shivajii]
MTSTPVPAADQEQSSDTPKRHRHDTSIPDYESPSAYLDSTYVSTSPNTPHGNEVKYDHIAITEGLVAHHQPPQHPVTLDDPYAFQYTGFPTDQRHLQHEEYVPMQEQITPPAPSREEDDRTPVVTEIQAQPINLPCPPNISGDRTIRASNHKKPPLMSPFKTFPDHQQPQHQQQQQQQMQQHQQQPQSPAYPLPIEHQQYLDNTAMYYSQQPGFIAYPQQISPSAPMSFAQFPPPPHFVNMPQQLNGIYPAEMYQPQPQYAFAGPPRSRNGSPTSSISSSAVSLARTASTSSDFRATRPKVKLTYEDKRNIVNLHRSNSSLRQEDIARMYGVDRSTISKIILSSHRWTQPQEPPAPPAPKVPKTVGGRFPAVEAKLDEWFDTQIAAGQDVRDNIAREKAKSFAKEIGFPMDRFKASAKWLDKFKDRRRAAGKPVPLQLDYGHFAYSAQPYPMMTSPMEGGVHLSRSQSTITLSSSDSSGQEQYQPPVYLQTDSAHSRMGSTRSESDLLNSYDVTPNSRSRSQSSPQVLGEPGMQSPSSGKVLKHRPTPIALQRQNSFHGSSPSPRRPQGLSRTNSIQGSARRQNRPLSLAASAFGFTNVDPTSSSQSPLQSPTPSHHSRQRSDVSIANGFTGMTLSPQVSDNGEGMMPMSMSLGTIPPLTPITPAQGNGVGHNGVFANTEYGEFQNELPISLPIQHQQIQQQMHYATMPNKHYMSHHQHQQQFPQAYIQQPGLMYPPNDFGPPQGYMIPQSQPQQWQ